MADVRIYRLPKSTDTQVLLTQSRPLRLARLNSLKSDPQNWSSKYDDESKHPEGSSFWINRLQPENVQHFVVVTSDETNVLSETLTIDEKTEFKAIMVIIDEYSEKQNKTTNDSEETEISNELPNYFLGALAVDSSLRGQGIGTRLINESIPWILEDAKRKNWSKVRYRTTAKKSNERAIKLYKKLGFIRIENDENQVHDESNGFIELSMILETA